VHYNDLRLLLRPGRLMLMLCSQARARAAEAVSMCAQKHKRSALNAPPPIPHTQKTTASASLSWRTSMARSALTMP
jgi:hypothetical protein